MKVLNSLFFSQTRIGQGGKPFTLYKFRTMRPVKPGEPELGTEANRITPFGRFLRRTSLDELPQLWNVLRGDMNLVGPRPLLPQYLERYTARQARRHQVKPGLTGWAQVSGRNALDWDTRLEMDVWYVENRSFWLDLKILALTVVQVFRGKGVQPAQGDFMTEFMGTSREKES